MMDYDHQNVENVLESKVNTDEAFRSIVEMIEPVCDDTEHQQYWFYGQRYPIDGSELIIDYDATPQQPERF